MPEPNEQIEALPLIRKRRLLGLIIPVVNAPLFVLSAYSLITLYMAGAPMSSEDFVSSAFVLVMSLALGLILPWYSPVYQSHYTLEAEGLRIRRILRSRILLPYSNIARAEVYIREPGEISEDALNYTKETSKKLSKLGFNFVDFTNSEANIVLLMSGRKLYMISPAKPRAFLKSLKRRAPKLTAKIVELNAEGKNVQELG